MRDDTFRKGYERPQMTEKIMTRDAINLFLPVNN